MIVLPEFPDGSFIRSGQYEDIPDVEWKTVDQE
jgi:hypothetical protein